MLRAGAGLQQRAAAIRAVLPREPATRHATSPPAMSASPAVYVAAMARMSSSET
jgi:hypothetical protein